MSTRKRTRQTVPEFETTDSSDNGSFDENGNQLSSYEVSRINNIKKNENFLASLGLDSVKQSIEYLKPTKKKPAATKGVPKNGPKPTALPVRRSGRVTTEKLKAEIEELLVEGKLTESTEKQEQLDAMLAKQREGIYEVPDGTVNTDESYNREIKLGPISMIDDMDNKIDEQDRSGQIIVDILRDYMSVQHIQSKVGLKTTPIPTQTSLTQYTTRLNSLSLAEGDVAKLTPARITSVFVHPCVEKVLVMAGDKNGCLGIWDLSHTAEVGTNVKGGSAAEGIYKYSPHISNLSNIYCHPEDSSKIYTVSYDGTIRCLDVSPDRSDTSATAFDLAFRHPLKDDDIRHFYYTDAAFHAQNKSVCLVSRSDGRVSLIDFRASATDYQNSGTVQDGVKINSLQYHPSNEFMVISAGAARGCIAINDTRMLSGVRDSSKLWASVNTLNLHSKSINAAYCSPVDGKYLVSVSQDNTVRVSENYLTKDGGKDQPSSSSSRASGVSPLISTVVKHDNHTGRWLSTFRPCFDPKQRDVFALGSMDQPRRVHIFGCGLSQPAHSSPVGIVATLRDNESLNSVCSRNAFHNTLDVVACGNSSGRVHVFR